MPGFTLNNAVDELFKREFDVHRAAETAHPLMKAYKLDAVPFKDDRMEEWRDALKRGIKFHHLPSNFILRGGIDDAWITPAGEVIVVDYKATSKKEGPTTEDDLYDLLQEADGGVSMALPAERLSRCIRPATSSTRTGIPTRRRSTRSSNSASSSSRTRARMPWVEPTLMRMRETLSADEIPDYGRGTAFGGKDCEYCCYRDNAGKAFKEHVAASKKK